MNSHVTNFYSPGSWVPLEFHPFKQTRVGRPRKLDQTSADHKQFTIQPGIANCAKQNNAFEDLTTALEVDLMTNKDIFEAYEAKYQLRLRQDPHFRDWNHHSDSSPPLLTISELEWIYLRLSNNWSLNSLSSKFGISIYRVREVFRVFK